jgi:hypothetical protein
MKPIFDFIENTEHDEEFYFRLYYMLMEINSSQ